MIPLLINGKKYSIKAISELTTKELIELSNLESPDIIKYIAWQTGIKYDDAFFSVLPKNFEAVIGKFPDIAKLPTAIVSYIDYSKQIETVGQRHQVEESGLTGLELLVFCLAVAQAQSLNIDDVKKLRDSYLEKPWQEILPAGFFFFKIYNHGRSRGLRFLIKVMGLIKTLQSKSRRVRNA